MSSADACSRLDQIVAQHDLDYTNAKSVTDYWKADAKLMHAIDNLPEPKTRTWRISQTTPQPLYARCFFFFSFN